ncbi:MAG: hypothetical protein K0Q94_4621 [Paenibacillus sp.]|nr:hypothetical protein [Paenibacillus sp.]
MKTQSFGYNAGYMLGCSSLLASLVYFFASNWGSLDRWQKFAPIMILLAALYGLSVYLAGRPGRQFLSRLSLFSCCITFGVALLVIGQTYNSHADSYALYAVWCAASIVFALQVNWQPFTVLAYILGTLAYWLYFFPNTGFVDYEDVEAIGILSLLAFINGLLYYLVRTNRLRGAFLAATAFTVLNGIVILLSNSFAFEDYAQIFNVAAVVLFAVWVRLYIREANQPYLLGTGLFVSVYLIMKYIELLLHFEAGESFFILSLLFAGLFIWGSAKWIQYVKSLVPPDDAEGDEEQKESGKALRHWIVRVLSITAIFVGTVIGAVSLIGFLILVFDLDEPLNVLNSAGLFLTIAMTAARKLNPVIRYSLLSIGLCIGVGSALFDEFTLLLLVYLVVCALMFTFATGLAERSMFFAAAVTIAGLWLFMLLDDTVQVLLLLTCVMPVISWLHRFVPVGTFRSAMRWCGYYSFLTLFLLLTFASQRYEYDLLYFIVLLACIVGAHRLGERAAYRVTFGFWTLFVFWKYYDTAWKLLHKSWSLALIGCLLLLVTYWLERKFRNAPEERLSDIRPRVRSFWMAAVVVSCLMLLSVQIGRSETILARGETVYLELLPLDPRSLLQGDYVQLRYTVSEPFGRDWTDNTPEESGKVSVVLAKSPSGVHQFKQLYDKSYALQPGEVVLNGKWRSWRTIEYGIEHFFVPEGTGMDVERTAKYAEVKVASNGDALVARLLPNLP